MDSGGRVNARRVLVATIKRGDKSAKNSPAHHGETIKTTAPLFASWRLAYIAVRPGGRRPDGGQDDADDGGGWQFDEDGFDGHDGRHSGLIRPNLTDYSLLNAWPLSDYFGCGGGGGGSYHVEGSTSGVTLLVATPWTL